MYAIYIRSQREPVVVSDYVGRDIKERWVKGTLASIVTLDDVSFEKTQIKSVVSKFIPDTSEEREEHDRSSNTAWLSDDWNNYRRFREDRLALPVEARAKDLSLAHLMYFAVTGEKEIPPKLQPAIIERQTAYLIKYPRLVWANPVCWRDLVHSVDLEVKSAALPMAYAIRENAARLVDRQCATDGQYAYPNR